ncbi:MULTISPECIES: hypothetical protein [Mycolicibacterium]|uniref:Uncharacterized protein n=1 Tax=Mycolicibacterium senegalense TaxID=1796 RepID=A0ABR5G1Z2_9MYCO|nr:MULTISPECIES: hypothetical protein [Mycolicibacterium]KLI04071.1 hypothetical protein AA982_32060 [Mycolicibacterium senegalense]KLO54225.1 hypothetical protein ABW05_24940 [Mycolicibacterium senegalense]OBK05366.1 hypothetical protein A5639_18785 [Mycolicibacterium conceptionense]OMB78547.1 hypothetical protein A5746_08315 [Mycolicibacterium conceptionense]OMB88970.1 hypothetical protein A5741_14385 [Mycolicibacterium conceptionense]
MPANQCPQGHEIRSAADRDGQGYCKRCKADNDKRRRVGKEAALMVVRAFEAAGVRFENDGIPVEPAEAARQLGELWADGYFETTQPH